MQADPYQHCREEMAKHLSEACKVSGFPVHLTDALRSLEDAKPEFGEIASTIAFTLARSARRNPKEIAAELAHHFGEHKFVERCEVLGAYINFRLSPHFLKYAMDLLVEQSRAYGSRESNGRVVYIEFPSVNPNKPWHVGHLRNAVLGDSVARLLSFTGFDVKRIDLINDLGLQVAQSVWGYLNLGDKIDMKADQWLGRQYVEVAKRIAEPEVEKQVREIVELMEHDAGDIAKIARKLCSQCVTAQYDTAFRLGIYHDLLIWESDLVQAHLLQNALEKAKASGAVELETEGKNAGCLVAKLAGREEFAQMESPDKVLVRSDGTATYTAKDLAFALWKFGLVDAQLSFSEFLKQPNGTMLYTSSKNGSSTRLPPAAVAINVIGVEQKYPQRVLSLLMESMGFGEQAKNYMHLAYEHAGLPDKKFSGREGSWLGYSADEVIDEAEARALTEIRARFADMADDEKTKIARAVGIGAVRFGLLRTTPEKKIIFKWEEALNFEGDSAPYIQYSHARCSRILEKAGEVLFGDISLLAEAEERELAVLLVRFPLRVLQASMEQRPHIIAEYLLDLSAQFSKFYNACPVLNAEPRMMEARLKLVKAAQIVLRNGLNLLGIEAPERM